MARRVFYSFHYKPDNWRASQVRNIGVVDGNDWEAVKRGGDKAIKKWISNQMQRRSCTIVLVGANTAERKWIKHEIIESWNNRMGIVGIHIHGLKDATGEVSAKGNNPFDRIYYGDSGRELSAIAKCYDPPGHSTHERYDWIKRHLASVVEEAVAIRNKY